MPKLGQSINEYILHHDTLSPSLETPSSSLSSQSCSLRLAVHQASLATLTTQTLSRDQVFGGWEYVFQSLLTSHQRTPVASARSCTNRFRNVQAMLRHMISAHLPCATQTVEFGHIADLKSDYHRPASGLVICICSAFTSHLLDCSS